MSYEIDVVNIRMVKEQSWYSRKPLESCKDVAELMADKLGDLDREVFCILNLATNGSVINLNIVSVGTLNAALVCPREVFKSSILSNAASIIAVHNHPSGNIIPSREDKQITQRLREVGRLLEIELKDHIIIGDKTGDYFSFFTEGILQNDFQREFLNREYDVER